MSRIGGMPVQNMDILLVDDRTDLLTLFGNYLSMQQGYSVERVHSPGDGLDLASTRSFGLIISNDTGRDGMKLETFASSQDIPLVRLKNERKRRGSAQFTLQAGDTVILEDSHQRMEFPLQNSAGLQALFLELARNLRQLMKIPKARHDFNATFGHPYDVICSAPVALCILHYPDVSWMNEEMAHVLGYAPSSLVSQPFSSLLVHDDDRRWFRELGVHTRGVAGWSQREVVLKKRDGAAIPCRLTFRSLAHASGDRHYICVCEDIRCQQSLLDLKQSFAQRIEEIENRYRRVLESMGAIVIRTDTDGNIIYCNPAAEMMFGFRSSEGPERNVVGTLVQAGSRAERDFVAMINGCSGNADECSVIAVDHILPGMRHVCIAWKMVGIQRDGQASDVVCVGEDITDYSCQIPGGIRTEPWRSRLLKGTDIQKEVFDDVFHICVEISREGWEGKRVGTSFLVGDAPAVIARSQPLIINSFDAMERERRFVGHPGNTTCIKNFAVLDGGFVINGDGFIEASGRQFLPGDIEVDLPPGYGTRHRSVAAMTMVTGAVGIVVSETGGRLTVFREGTIVKSLIF
ncbi:MAG: PAS domain-containing protein [Methanolinea sp.]|jgi:PAS domain S-box-containing protein|nr:PAS domain-containing protein [Methanolinea sp.]